MASQYEQYPNCMERCELYDLVLAHLSERRDETFPIPFSNADTRRELIRALQRTTAPEADVYVFKKLGFCPIAQLVERPIGEVLGSVEHGLCASLDERYRPGIQVRPLSKTQETAREAGDEPETVL